MNRATNMEQRSTAVSTKLQMAARTQVIVRARGAALG